MKNTKIVAILVTLLFMAVVNAQNVDCYMEQGGSKFVAASGCTIEVLSGGVIDATAATGLVTFAAGEIVAADLATDAVETAKIKDANVTAAKLTATMQKGFINLDLGSAREITSNDIGNIAANGGLLATDSTPTYERINGATDKGLRVLWATSNVDAIQFEPIALPPDLDDAAAITVHFYAEMSGATDTPTLTVAAFFNVGDTDAGGATGALADAVGEVTVSIAAGDVPAAPGVLNLEVLPGTHGTDTVDLYAAWIEYTRK